MTLHTLFPRHDRCRGKSTFPLRSLRAHLPRPGACGILVVLLSLCAGPWTPARGMDGGLPAPGNNKVAYYVFDSGGPDHFPLTTFTDAANIVVLFEGTLWELADSVHYHSGWMGNAIYTSYARILRDVRVLQARGVKVLMNVDDAASWSTSTPFMTYDSTNLDYRQFAAFVKTCAIDSLHLDGISLDIEHKATGNAAYIALLKELGKYFGPLSANASSQIYAAAIYAGSYGVPGSGDREVARGWRVLQLCDGYGLFQFELCLPLQAMGRFHRLLQDDDRRCQRSE